MTDTIIRILVYGAFAIIFGAIFYQKFAGKKKYANVEFKEDPNWLEESMDSYSDDPTQKNYFLHYDKKLLNQGHVLDDENHKTVYEVQFLYNNGFEADEVDFVNHILNKTTHHKIGKTGTVSVESDGVGADVASSFTFDGEDIFEYLRKKGYNYSYKIHLLAYRIEITKDGQLVGTIYSSNNGKNLYEREGEEIVEKAGGKGFNIIQCADRYLDIMMLYGIAFARSEFDAEKMAHTEKLF